MKKILLHTDQKKYDLALQRYADYVAKKEQIFNVAESLGYAIPKDTTNFKEAIYEAVSIANADKNPMHLKPQKLTELLEVPLEPFNMAIEDMEKALATAWTGYKLVSPAWPEPKQPDIENYRTYAETPEQIERFKAVKNLHKAIAVAERFSPSTGVFNKHEIRKTFGHFFNDEPFAGVEKGLSVSTSFVVSGRSY